jgi:integrase
MRLGELLGLGWRNVDLATGRIEVRRNLQRDRVTHALYLKTPKSDAGKRNIILVPQAAEALRRQRTWQREARLAAGAAWGQGERRTTSCSATS